MVERRKQIEIEEQEIKRKEKELIATVKFAAFGKCQNFSEQNSKSNTTNHYEKELIATVRFAAFGKCQNFAENQCLLNKIAKVILRIRVSQMKILSI